MKTAQSNVNVMATVNVCMTLQMGNIFALSVYITHRSNISHLL